MNVPRLVTWLLLFLLFPPAALELSTPVAAAAPSQGAPRTAAQVLDIDAAATAFDDNGANFNILAHLTLLSNTTHLFADANNYTVLAPDDDAVRATLAALGLQTPSERAAHDAIVLLATRAYGTPASALAELVHFHVLPMPLRASELLRENSNSSDLETLAGGRTLGAVGAGLKDYEPALAPARLHARRRDIATTGGGVLHVVSRALLTRHVLPGGGVPDMSHIAGDHNTGLDTGMVQAADSDLEAELDRQEAVEASPEPSLEGSPEESPDASGEAWPDAEEAEPWTDPATPTAGSCFPADARLYTASAKGFVTAAEVRAGTIVTADERGSHSAIYMFSHRLPEAFAEFVRLCDGKGCLTVSPDHLVYRANGERVPARNIRRFDALRGVKGPRVVEEVTRVRRRGLFAPHSMHGDLVVDGFVVSSYTDSLPATLSHAALWPVRAAVRLGLREPLGGLFYGGWPGMSALLRRVTSAVGVY